MQIKSDKGVHMRTKPTVGLIPPTWDDVTEYWVDFEQTGGAVTAL